MPGIRGSRVHSSLALEKRLLAITDPDLVRFLDAQASVHEEVVQELTDGCKRTHWIWFIFPQLAGLGHSPTAQRYVIRDLEQAKQYLPDPILGSRLRQDIRLVMKHKDRSALEILGSFDDLTFRSCLTLFAQATSNSPDRALFEKALHQFYEDPDPRTMQLLAAISKS
jgi:uncharacterized protein (DUF1810 family)